MNTVVMDQKEELVMRLVHFFITKCNYTPIIVNGVQNEVWLENIDGPYRIIRINSNYIHNIEQFNLDISKINNIVKQIKKKTLTLSMNTLNINLDLNNNVKLNDVKNIDSVFIKNKNDIKHNQIIVESFPDIKNDLLDDEKGIDLIINVTNDINKKTAKTNKLYEKVFKQKKIVITPILIVLCVIMFFVTTLVPEVGIMLANQKSFLRAGEWWRILTCAFIHGGIIHLLCNMYSLYIIGNQLENVIGKVKFIFIYLFSAIMGSLLSSTFSTAFSVGASGAIFGLMGSLLYFGYHYRLYLGSAIKNQIIPVIVLNLILGFTISGIDNMAHIGGLIGGYLATMIVGIDGKTKKAEQINGIIVSILFIGILIFMIMK